MNHKRQAISIVGLLATIAAAVYMVVQLNGQEKAPAGEPHGLLVCGHGVQSFIPRRTFRQRCDRRSPRRRRVDCRLCIGARDHSATQRRINASLTGSRA